LRVRAAARSALWLVLFCVSLAAWAVVSFLLPAPMRHSLAWSRGWLAPLAVALLALATATLVAGAWKGAFSRLTLTALAAGLVLADVLPWGAGQMPTIGAAYFTNPPSTARALLRDGSWFRIMTWRRVFGPMSPTQWPDRRPFRALREYLAPDIPSAYGIRSLEGYSAFSPARAQAFFHLARVVFRRGDQDTRLLDAAGVKYIVSEEPLRAGHLALIRQGAVSIYRNPGFLGPCWVVPWVVVLNDPDQVADFMSSTAFQPDRVAVLEAPAEPLAQTTERFHGEARAVRLDPARMEFQAAASEAGVMVVNAAAYDSGWEATVDGERVPVYAANQMFMAIPLTAGNHRVILSYDSLPYAAGRQVSLATAFLVLLLLAWWWRRRATAAR
jgi:hypothetical protein